MKTFYIVLICVLYAVTHTNANMDKVLATLKLCNEKFPVAPEEFAKFLYDKHAEDHFKCHVKCIMEMQETFKDGEFKDDIFLKHIMEVPFIKNHTEEIQTVINECKKLSNTDDCDTAFNIAVCILDNSPALSEATLEHFL
ncbi:general odorant-binding protein 56h-like [Musca autumnalis]|uniref:general odorant-binding protein 56h-like n=1 Tax=Musca autumnalis TaxID=221902 RepID=UPI003CFAB263